MRKEVDQHSGHHILLFTILINLQSFLKAYFLVSFIGATEVPDEND